KKNPLSALGGGDARTAHVTSVIALAIPGRKTRTYTGELHGRILESHARAGGFGYDPLFETDDGQTLGMITPSEKGEISHRRNALDRLREDTGVFDVLVRHERKDPN